jgi:hypothetical protein
MSGSLDPLEPPDTPVAQLADAIAAAIGAARERGMSVEAIPPSSPRLPPCCAKAAPDRAGLAQNLIDNADENVVMPQSLMVSVEHGRYSRVRCRRYR